MAQSTVRDYRKLKMWQRAHALTLRIYNVTSSFPKSELYGLTSQMRRASVSIAANMAEGCGRRGEVELARFMTIAQGSATETDYLCLLARDMGYLDATTASERIEICNEVNRMLTAYISRLKSTS